MKKYELFKKEGNLWRIRALGDFGVVKAGEIGGLIEKEENLSHYGDCWVFGDAWVCGNAWVYEDAWVSGDAEVSGDAQIYGDARVFGDALVSGKAQVYGNAHVFGDAEVSGKAQVYGNALVSGDAEVSGDRELKTGCFTKKQQDKKNINCDEKNESDLKQSEIIEKIEVMQAYEDGFKISFKSKKDSFWIECLSPSWNWENFEYKVSGPYFKADFYRFLFELENTCNDTFKKLTIDKKHNKIREYMSCIVGDYRSFKNFKEVLENIGYKNYAIYIIGYLYFSDRCTLFEALDIYCKKYKEYQSSSDNVNYEQFVKNSIFMDKNYFEMREYCYGYLNAECEYRK